MSFDDSPPLTWSKHYPPQNTPKQLNHEEALQKFILSQETQISQLENQFRQQQVEMNNKVNNLMRVISDHIAGRSTCKVAKTEEIKSVTVTHPTASPVKIKSPSKIFKHITPNEKETRESHTPSKPPHFVNTITTIPTPKPNTNQQLTGSMSNRIGERIKEGESEGRGELMSMEVNKIDLVPLDGGNTCHNS